MRRRNLLIGLLAVLIAGVVAESVAHPLHLTRSSRAPLQRATVSLIGDSLNLGVEPYLVSSSVIGVVAQRLVRLICKQCKTEHDATDRELAGIGLTMKDVPTGKIMKGKGCPYCLNSGYQDRTAIFEIFTVDDVVREQTMKRVGSTFIKQDAIKRGMRTLRMDGARKVLSGKTTPEEVLRVTQMDTF